MNKQIIYVIGLLLVSAVGYVAVEDSNIFFKVKSGQVKLSCNTGFGEKIIAPEHVIAFENGIWIFVNGQSKSCRILKK